MWPLNAFVHVNAHMVFDLILFGSELAVVVVCDLDFVLRYIESGSRFS